jgi:hypothetical protein
VLPRSMSKEENPLGQSRVENAGAKSESP